MMVYFTFLNERMGNEFSRSQSPSLITILLRWKINWLEVYNLKCFCRIITLFHSIVWGQHVWHLLILMHLLRILIWDFVYMQSQMQSMSFMISWMGAFNDDEPLDKLSEVVMKFHLVRLSDSFYFPFMEHNYIWNDNRYISGELLYYLIR